MENILKYLSLMARLGLQTLINLDMLQSFRKAIQILSLTAFFVPSIYSQDVQSYQVIYHYPIRLSEQTSDASVLYLIDTITILHAGKFAIYRFPTTKDWTTDESIRGNERYFIRMGGDRMGYYFKDFNADPVKYNADSFLRQNAMSTLEFAIPAGDSWLLVNSTTDHTKDLYCDLYAARKQDQNGGLSPDSFYFYYSTSLKGLDYTMSPALDSARGMKLCKVRMIQNKRKTSPLVEFSWEIKETPGTEQEKIKKVLEILVPKISGSE
jgi:hypothetical protein